MRTCQRCDQLIVGEAEEVVPDSASGARPTLWRHKQLTECEQAQWDDRGTHFRSSLRP
ncbi:hypothetical protein ACFVU3_00365 [Streptomyces sp. NPDC058052]|uniref:hypothetical protein n=1 Tax=Streptomyces sp. NPDC058052 TaxID=3346316 RepID=UPI0036F0AF3B